MKPSLRILLPCLLAGSSLLLLSGCGELDDARGGREYHRRSAGVSYRTDRDYDDGGSYYSGRQYAVVDRSDRYDRDRSDRDWNRDGDRHDRRSTYQDNSRTVVSVRDSSPYESRSHSSYDRSRTSVAATSRNSYPERTHSGSGTYSRSSATVAAPSTTRGAYNGTHRSNPAGVNRSGTTVVVNAAPSKEKKKDHEKKND